MGIFTLPPKMPRADLLDVESYLRSDSRQSPIRRFRRTLAAEWFPQSGVQLTWPHGETDWAPMLQEVTETYIRIALIFLGFTAFLYIISILFISLAPQTIRGLATMVSSQ